jgi:hypothetical protein
LNKSCLTKIVMGVVFSWGLFQFCSWSVLLYVVVVVENCWPLVVVVVLMMIDATRNRIYVAVVFVVKPDEQQVADRMPVLPGLIDLTVVTKSRIYVAAAFVAAVVIEQDFCCWQVQVVGSMQTLLIDAKKMDLFSDNCCWLVLVLLYLKRVLVVMDYLMTMMPLSVCAAAALVLPSSWTTTKLKQHVLVVFAVVVFAVAFFWEPMVVETTVALLSPPPPPPVVPFVFVELEQR